MAKIISAFPCMGKTHCSKNNDRVLDLESSDYFFEKKGFEHLSNENFKGLQNRIKRETGLEDYTSAIIAAESSGKYDYIFISQSPDVIKELLKLKKEVSLLKPVPNKESLLNFREIATNRGNNIEWITSTEKFLFRELEEDYSESEIAQLSVAFVNPEIYISDLIRDGLI
jgi:hypothetical protein